jgi:hypothetical protein
MAEESCARSCASLTLELNGTAEWSRTEGGELVKGRSFLEKGNGRSTENQLLKLMPGPQRITHANLLQINSIRINRRRPLHYDLNEVQFRAGTVF